MPADPRTGEKSECPYCKRPFATAYLQTHVRRQHKIYGGVTGRARKKTQEDFSVPTAHPEENGAVDPLGSIGPELRQLHALGKVPVGFTVVPQFVVLEDSNGTLWLAEKLR